MGLKPSRSTSRRYLEESLAPGPCIVWMHMQQVKMVKSGIKIFARIRPTKKTTGVGRAHIVRRPMYSVALMHLCSHDSLHACPQLYGVDELEDGAGVISVTVPRSEASGLVNNKKETQAFRSV